MNRATESTLIPLLISTLIVMITIRPACAQSAQEVENPAPLNMDLLTHGRSLFPLVWNPYRPVPLPPANLTNGAAVSARIREHRLKLSLSDFLQLVVENSLDLESARYNYVIAEADLRRAQSGQAARGAPDATLPGALFAGAIGAGVGNNANVSAGGTGGTSISASARQVTIGPRGAFDPTISVNVSWDRVVNPLNTARVAGTSTVAIPSADLQTRYQQELPFGTSFALSFNVQRQTTTQAHILYNPAFTSYFSAQIYQPLMNGYGRAFNQRFVTLAENDRHIVYEAFHTNLNTTLSAAANAYWDFVALRETERVAEQALVVAETLYRDTQQRIELGNLPRTELVNAESRVASSRRDFIIAQTNVELQEVQLKSLMTRVLGPEIDAVPFEPADSLSGVLEKPIPPLADQLRSAMGRSSIRQAELGLQNQKIAEEFTRSNLKPTLSVFAQVNNYTLAPGLNQMFRQLIQYAYPEYSVGLTLSFPIKNRAAQADDVRARMERQQAQVGFEQTKANVDVQVRTAVTNLTQARSQVEAAERAVTASQTAADAEQEKWSEGISTLDNVFQTQLDLITAQAAEIQSRVNYAKAVIAQEVAVGNLLESHKIDFDKALQGTLWKGSAKR